MRFSWYCETWKSGPTLDELLAHQREHQDLFAHAEESGCEGCYCEVARWNESARQWQRYAFDKFFGGEIPEMPDANCQQTATAVAEMINQLGYNATFSNVIHRMPPWKENVA